MRCTQGTLGHLEADVGDRGYFPARAKGRGKKQRARSRQIARLMASCSASLRGVIMQREVVMWGPASEGDGGWWRPRPICPQPICLCTPPLGTPRPGCQMTIASRAAPRESGTLRSLCPGELWAERQEGAWAHRRTVIGPRPSRGTRLVSHKHTIGTGGAGHAAIDLDRQSPSTNRVGPITQYPASALRRGRVRCTAQARWASGARRMRSRR